MTVDRKPDISLDDCLSGDPVAFGRLVTRFEKPLFGFLGRMGFEQSVAEELAQETFLRAWKNRQSFDSNKARVSTWLFTIARNLAINEIDLQPSVTGDANSSEQPSTHPSTDPAQQYASHEAIERLRRALKTLSVEDRAAIAVIYVVDLTEKDAAQLMNCSVGAYRTRLSRARKRLAAAMKRLADDL